jgi:hypothetical protein
MQLLFVEVFPLEVLRRGGGQQLQRLVIEGIIG